MINQFFCTIDHHDQQPTRPSGHSSSRRAFLCRSVAGAAFVAPVTLLAACGSTSNPVAKTNTHNTTAVAPTSTTTGTNMLALPALRDSKAVFTDIMNDENSHVTALKVALTKAGVTPRPKPTFKGLAQTDLNAFAGLAQVFENVGVGAYLTAVPVIASKIYLAEAASILTIEARHAGFLNVLLSKPISANGAFDKALTQAEIVKDVMPFISSLNGGKDPSTPLANDVEILNFALLLEYLEAEFYNTNVPNLFK